MLFLKSLWSKLLYSEESQERMFLCSFWAVQQPLMDFIWSLIFQSSLPYHGYRTALLSYPKILCNKFITLRNLAKINLPPRLKTHVRRQTWLNISSSKSQSRNTNLRSTTLLSVLVHQTQNRIQTWCWGPQKAESGLLDFLKSLGLLAETSLVDCVFFCFLVLGVFFGFLGGFEGFFEVFWCFGFWFWCFGVGVFLCFGFGFWCFMGFLVFWFLFCFGLVCLLACVCFVLCCSVSFFLNSVH